MKNKVLITGASGFIGSFLVEEALDQGYDVFAGTRHSSNREFLRDQRIHFFEMDFSSRTALEAKFTDLVKKGEGFDFVIHNAGITHASSKEDFIKINYLLTKDLVDAIRASGMKMKKFLFVSSLAVFGPGNAKTFEPIKVSDQPQPISSYGKSKLRAEQYLQSLPDFPYLIVNPTAVFGPRDKDFLTMMKMFNLGFEFYIGCHRQMISLIYVKDLVRVIVSAMASPHVQRSYLVSDGHQYNKEQLGEVMRRALRKKTLKLKLPESIFQLVVLGIEKIYMLVGKRAFINVEKAKEISSANWLCHSEEIWRDLETEPIFGLPNGIKETVAWYIERGWLN